MQQTTIYTYSDDIAHWPLNWHSSCMQKGLMQQLHCKHRRPTYVTHWMTPCTNGTEVYRSFILCLLIPKSRKTSSLQPKNDIQTKSA